jgi:hypothetical protein
MVSIEQVGEEELVAGDLTQYFRPLAAGCVGWRGFRPGRCSDSRGSGEGGASVQGGTL